MKKGIIITAITTCLLLCVVLGFRFVFGGINSLLSETPTEDLNCSSDYFIIYNNELYTPYYKDNFRLGDSFFPNIEPNSKKVKVDCVDATNTEKVVFSTRIRTYKNDPENNFIYECGFLSDGEIFRKASFQIPDYLSDNAPISRIVLEATMDADGNDRSESKIIESPDLIESFMQTVRKAAENQDPSATVPVGSYETYDCYVEFEGICGTFYIGFIRSTADGLYGFSSAEIDHQYFSDPYGFIPLTEEFCKYVVF